MISGIVPEYLALMQERAQVLAGMPQRFKVDMSVEESQLVQRGMNPRDAAAAELPTEINMMKTYYSSEPDAASWLNMWQGLNQDLADWNNRWAPFLPKQ